MNDINKINEEIKNYKLFKIQRMNTKIQEFSEIKDNLINIQKNEVLSYVLVSINGIFTLTFLFFCFKSYQDNAFFYNYYGFIVINIFCCLTLSLFFTYRLILCNKKLKEHMTSTENAISYFSNESESLKSIYESYIDAELDKIRDAKKKRDS